MVDRPGLLLIIASSLVLACADTAPAEEPFAARRERIENMDAAQKEHLFQRHKQFHAFTPEEQERFRELHRDVEHDPDCDELRRVMNRYYDWLKTLSSYQLMELRRLPAKERIERIKKLQQEQRGHGRGRPGYGRFGLGFGKTAEKISPADKEALLKWIAEYAARHEDAFTERLPESAREGLRRELGKIDDSQKRLQILFWRIWLRRQLDDPKKPIPGIDDDWPRLLEAFSPETRRALESLPKDQQHAAITGMIRAMAVAGYFAHRMDPMPAVITDKEAEDFFAKHLDPGRRSWLTDLPPDEMKRWTWRMYLASKLPRPHPMAPGGPRRPGPSRHGPPQRGGGMRPDSGPQGPSADKRPGPEDRSRRPADGRNRSEKSPRRAEKGPQHR